MSYSNYDDSFEVVVKYEQVKGDIASVQHEIQGWWKSQGISEDKLLDMCFLRKGNRLTAQYKHQIPFPEYPDQRSCDEEEGSGMTMKDYLTIQNL